MDTDTHKDRTCEKTKMDQREFGRLEGKVEAMEKRVEKMEQDFFRVTTEIKSKVDGMDETLREISDTIHQTKGGWKTLTIASSIVAAIASAIAWLLGFFHS